MGHRSGARCLHTTCAARFLQFEALRGLNSSVVVPWSKNTPTTWGFQHPIRFWSLGSSSFCTYEDPLRARKLDRTEPPFGCLKGTKGHQFVGWKQLSVQGEPFPRRESFDHGAESGVLPGSEWLKRVTHEGPKRCLWRRLCCYLGVA